MIFSLGNKKLRYKFLYDTSENVIDLTIRKEFKIPSNVEYSLVDMADTAVVNFSSLFHLDNESNIGIEIQEIGESTKNKSIDLR